MRTHTGELGKSRHSGAGMMWRLNPATGEIEFLIISRQKPGGRELFMFPGASNRLRKKPPVYRDEQPIRTMARAWADLTGLKLHTASKHPAKFEHDDGSAEYFYLLDQTDLEEGVGELRTNDLRIPIGPGNEEVIFQPRWMSAELIKKGERQALHNNHARALAIVVGVIRSRLATPVEAEAAAS